MVYVTRFSTDLMFGCLLRGNRPKLLALPLSYLHHYHPMPEGMRVRALPSQYVEMNLMPKEAVDRKRRCAFAAFAQGLSAAGVCIGEGA